MQQPVSRASRQPVDEDAAFAWQIVLSAARCAEHLADVNQFAAHALAPNGQLREVALGDSNAVVAWRPGTGWELLLPPSDPRHASIDLYLPICSATAPRPMTIGHLGQSLDGFIATHAGESRWVTGQENLLHMHRLRALCDAVVVGAGTVAADDPQLTTRLVPGPSPLRVILDPGRRLDEDHQVFRHSAPETWYVCARSLLRGDAPRFGQARVVGIDGGADGVDLSELMRLLRARDCTRVFVEGGGVTVSMFVQANLLDRLHMAIAPLLIGDGRPAIRLAPHALLGDCHRPRYRVFRMGTDVLFDCELGSNETGPERPSEAHPAVTRVI